EKTRGWTEATVLRTAPCLFGLYAVIAVWYAELPARWRRQRAMRRGDDAAVTFADAITAVRRWLWWDGFLQPRCMERPLRKSRPGYATCCYVASPQRRENREKGQKSSLAAGAAGPDLAQGLPHRGGLRLGRGTDEDAVVLVLGARPGVYLQAEGL